MSSVDVDDLANFEDATGDNASDEAIVREAMTRFKRGMDFEADARRNFVNDIKFANGDSYNGWQWDSDMVTIREGDQRPCMTVNKVRQHNLQIENDAKQNKTGVKVSPVGDGATAEAADAFEGVIRHIEYISNASIAYDVATETQVQAGVGYFRLRTDFASDDTFDQEIFIDEIPDPLTVLLDTDCKKKDRSDARWGFIFTDITREQFESEYPEWKDKAVFSSAGAFGDMGQGWIAKDHVRICEYYRAGEEDDELLGWPDKDGSIKSGRASTLGPELTKEIKKRKDVSARRVTKPKIEWFKIVGHDIVDRRDQIWKTIPIYMVIGEETYIDGRYDRKGHTRSMLDAQRNFNYQLSAAVEATSLYTKTPWLTAVEAIDGNEEAWANANRQNAAYLTWKSYNDEGKEIPPPQRIEPPNLAIAYVKLMEVATENIQAVSGQHEAEMGKEGNERSGVAIQQRQRQGDRATYHFIDNLAIAIRRLGKDLIYAIPKVYDTKRTILIMGEDGSQSQVMIDPSAQAAYAEEQKEAQVGAVAIFNPNVGRYDVQADTGPGYATKRQESFNAFSQILAASPDLVHVIGDLMFKNMDVAGADDIAERLRRMVPPQALGEGPPPEVAQLTQQVQELTLKAQKDDVRVGKLELALKGKDQLRDIEAMNADTRRLVALKDSLPMDLEGLHALIQQTVRDAMQSGAAPIDAANAPTLAADATQPDLSAPEPPIAPQSSMGQTQASPAPNGAAQPPV